MNELGTLADWAQIVSVPLALISTVVATALAIYIHRSQKQKRSLTCVFDDAKSQIEVKADESLRGTLAVTYNGTPISNLYILRARLKNSGTLPIRKADFIKPLIISLGFDLEGKIFLAQVNNKEPENLNVSARVLEGTQPSDVQLDLDLLNPDEGFTVEILYTALPGDSAIPTVSARIEGIKAIELQSQRNDSREEINLQNIDLIYLKLMGVLPGLLAGYIAPTIAGPLALGLLALFIFAQITNRRSWVSQRMIASLVLYTGFQLGLLIMVSSF